MKLSPIVIFRKGRENIAKAVILIAEFFYTENKLEVRSTLYLKMMVETWNIFTLIVKSTEVRLNIFIKLLF